MGKSQTGRKGFRYMKDTVEYIDQFVEKLGRDLLKDIRHAVPKHIETIIEQRFKGIRSSLEALERIEQEQKAMGKDIETLMISYKKLEGNYLDLTINSNSLPAEVKSAVDEGNKKVAGALAKDIENMTDTKKKAKFLTRFFKRGKK